MTSRSKPSEGWGWPLLAIKQHYFVDGSSLCGAYTAFGGVLEAGPALAGDCTRCTHALERRGAPPAPAVPIVRSEARH